MCLYLIRWMTTQEVIEDTGLHTYRIGHNPDYREAVSALREKLELMQRGEDESESEWSRETPER